MKKNNKEKVEIHDYLITMMVNIKIKIKQIEKSLKRKTSLENKVCICIGRYIFKYHRF